jgi:hypothetical protein
VTSQLADTVAVFRRWLYLPDPAALYAVLGAVAANRLDGDPVWLLLVGPPGSGKSELLQSLGSLSDVHPTATLTEAALLSGTPKRERADTATGGLLRTIGPFGIILAKDFGSVLSMHRDARSAVLAALREVYDGDWTRHVGSDGGRTLHWSGKVGLVAGCTPTIDRHAAVMGAMGERFVLLRLPRVEAREQARRALAHAGAERTMRRELSAAVTALFDHQGVISKRVERDANRLVDLAALVVRCRSAVERDGYTREVELIPESEAPTRLVVVLDRLLAGLHSIGIDPDTAWRVIGTAALDSIPALRRAVMDGLANAVGELTTAKLAEAIGYPSKTTERTLEDLVAHGVVNVHRHGQGKATTWELASWATQGYAAATSPEMSEAVGSTSPEMSGETPLSLSTHSKDKSGEVAPGANTSQQALDPHPLTARTSCAGPAADASTVGEIDGQSLPDGWTLGEAEEVAAEFAADEAEGRQRGALPS